MSPCLIVIPQTKGPAILLLGSLPFLTSTSTCQETKRFEVVLPLVKWHLQRRCARPIDCISCFKHAFLSVKKADTYWGRFYFDNPSLLSNGLYFCNVAKWILKFLPCRLKNRSFRGRNEFPFNFNHCCFVSSLYRHMCYSIKAWYLVYIPVIKSS